jgi:hypothetical protein
MQLGLATIEPLSAQAPRVSKLASLVSRPSTHQLLLLPPALLQVCLSLCKASLCVGLQDRGLRLQYGSARCRCGSARCERKFQVGMSVAIGLNGTLDRCQKWAPEEAWFDTLTVRHSCRMQCSTYTLPKAEGCGCLLLVPSGCPTRRCPYPLPLASQQSPPAQAHLQNDSDLVRLLLLDLHGRPAHCVLIHSTQLHLAARILQLPQLCLQVIRLGLARTAQQWHGRYGTAWFGTTRHDTTRQSMAVCDGGRLDIAR